MYVFMYALCMLLFFQYSVERSFSKQGFIHSDRRNRCSDELIESQMMISFNDKSLSDLSTSVLYENNVTQLADDLVDDDVVDEDVIDDDEDENDIFDDLFSSSSSSSSSSTSSSSSSLKNDSSQNNCNNRYNNYNDDNDIDEEDNDHDSSSSNSLKRVHSTIENDNEIAAVLSASFVAAAKTTKSGRQVRPRI